MEPYLGARRTPVGDHELRQRVMFGIRVIDDWACIALVQPDFVFHDCPAPLGGNGPLPPIDCAIGSIVPGESSRDRAGCSLANPVSALRIRSVGRKVNKTFVD